MTGLRVMPLLERENDAGGRFTEWPGPNSHAAHRICADATASYASAARPDVARRADEADMGATPHAEGLVRAWGQVCFHTLAPALRGSLPVHGSLGGKAVQRRWRRGGSAKPVRPPSLNSRQQAVRPIVQAVSARDQVRTPSPTDGRLGSAPGRRARAGGPATPMIVTSRHGARPSDIGGDAGASLVLSLPCRRYVDLVSGRRFFIACGHRTGAPRLSKLPRVRQVRCAPPEVSATRDTCEGSCIKTASIWLQAAGQ